MVPMLVSAGGAQVVLGTSAWGKWLTSAIAVWCYVHVLGEEQTSHVSWLSRGELEQNETGEIWHGKHVATGVYLWPYSHDGIFGAFWSVRSEGNNLEPPRLSVDRWNWRTQTKTSRLYYELSVPPQ